jgi:hypothetical protein
MSICVSFHPDHMPTDREIAPRTPATMPPHYPLPTCRFSRNFPSSGRALLRVVIGKSMEYEIALSDAPPSEVKKRPSVLKAKLTTQ